MSDISVLGIFVADISFSGPKIPAIGETILGNKYNVGPGGKGCNQAIAIARLGAKVNFISKIGKDSYGELALKTLTKNKINMGPENIAQVEIEEELRLGWRIKRSSTMTLVKVGIPLIFLTLQKN